MKELDRAVIFVSPHVNMDGAERSMLAWASYLHDNCGVHPVFILPKHGIVENELKKSGFAYYIIPFWVIINNGKGRRLCHGILKLLLNVMAAMVLTIRLAPYRRRCITVHSNSAITDLGPILAMLMMRPHLWHFREYGKKDFNYDYDLGHFPFRFFLRKSVAVVCNSRSVLEHYRTTFGEACYVTVYNGVRIADLEEIAERGKRHERKTCLRGVFAGRMTAEKNHILALKACQVMSDKGESFFRIDLYGSGPLEAELKQYVVKHNLTQMVSFLGYCFDIPFGNYDFGLMCSPNEAFGRVTAEYMGAGIPVVGIDAGGTSEIVDKQSGILVQDARPETLYEAVKYLFNNQDDMSEMGRHAYERARLHFSENVYFNNMHTLYKQLFSI